MKAKSGRKKKEKQVTLVIFPDLTAVPRSYTFAQKNIRRSAVLLGAVIIIFILLGYSFINGLDSMNYISKLKRENTAKEKTINQLQTEINQLNEQQEALEQKQQEIRKLMGLPAAESRKSSVPNGQGGDGAEVASGDEAAIKLASRIKTNLDGKEKELDELLARAKKDSAYFRSIPNLWPAQGELTSGFGLRKSPMGGRNSSFHEGVDIANKVGTPVAASGDGVVTFAGVMPVYGRTILISHGNGLETKYGHNSQLLVKKGDKVKKGQVIAKMGSTGRSTGPHLHFGVYKNGKLVDPMVYLPAR
jgi:murein DD-endopeptidase MepM/ murein hydrolase activator NlpD